MWFFAIVFTIAIGALIAVRIYANRLRAQERLLNTKLLEVCGISITLDINEKPSLFVLLSADGSTNRMGSGRFDDTESELFIGLTSPVTFESVRSQLSGEVWQCMGRTFTSPHLRGAACKLTILLQFKDGSSNGFAFLYGAESDGPPKFVADLVRVAVRETNPWYENFRREALAHKKS